MGWLQSCCNMQECNRSAKKEWVGGVQLQWVGDVW